MNNVIRFQDYSDNKDSQIRAYSIIDMILDPKKRKEVYDYYDSKYKDIDEEKQIFETMTKRRSE